MSKIRSRSVSALSVAVETLEGRLLLSGIAPVSGPAAAVHQHTMDVAAKAVRQTATGTSLAVSAGTLGQPITFTVTVRAAASAGSPEGTVNLMDHGQVIQTLTLTPMTSTNARFAFSEATYTLTQQPGGSAYYFGRHAVSAELIPSGTFSKSTGRQTFSVSEPAYTTLSGGVKIATIVHGSGPEIQSGQTAGVLYTGYLARNGRLFDDSNNNAGAPISFAVGTGTVIPGFDAGTAGMQVGDTRIVFIPPAQAYGRTAAGNVPANSTLIFVVTLESIS
jgi:peptidylprolyl isomerase